VGIPVNERLGFEAGDVSDPAEEIVLHWTVPEEYVNSVGNLQGGILAAFADAVLGGATSAHLPADRYPALAEMKISIFRPAPAGTRLTGRGYVIKAGKRVLFAEAEITDEEGQPIAKASGTEIPTSD
jgi:uncharacterized protein (TIGR00369 family)